MNEFIPFEEDQPALGPENPNQGPVSGLEQDVRGTLNELSAVPPTEKIGQDEFLQERGSTLRNVWGRAKDIVRNIGDHFAIEHEGVRLTPMQNIRARFANVGVVMRAIHSNDADERRYLMTNIGANPVVQKAIQKDKEKQLRRSLSPDEAFYYHTGVDILKIAAYELGTLPVVRAMGLMAIHGTAKGLEAVSEDSSRASNFAKKVKDNTRQRLDLHEKNLHNPTIRRLQGTKWQEVKPGAKPAAATAGRLRNPFID